MMSSIQVHNSSKVVIGNGRLNSQLVVRNLCTVCHGRSHMNTANQQVHISHGRKVPVIWLHLFVQVDISKF